MLELAKEVLKILGLTCMLGILVLVLSGFTIEHLRCQLTAVWGPPIPDCYVKWYNDSTGTPVYLSY